MNKLPFLQSKGPQAPKKYLGEARYAFDEASELVEQALDELIHAIETKDTQKLVQSIMAVIDCIMAKEEGRENAPDSLKEASSI